MQKNSYKEILIIMLVFAFLTFGCVVSAVAAAAPGLPEVGETVRVNAVVIDVKGLFGFRFDVSYDSTVLKFKSAAEGNFLKADGAPTFFNPPRDDGKGNVKGAGATRLVKPGVDGTGVLAIFEFEVIAAKEIKMGLANVELADVNAIKIPNPNVKLMIGDVVVGGTTLVPTPVPAPVPVAATGIITTVAGTGQSGFSGDGGKATQAGLRSPSRVFVDPIGNLFIADTGNNRIRQVDGQTAIITTVAGGGLSFDDGVKATQAFLSSPQGVFVDSAGNLFIADTDNDRIRRVDGKTGIITTVAGTRQEGFSGDEGKATEAKLNTPKDIFVDSAGNLFIADTFNHRIRRVDGKVGIITTVAGIGQPGFLGDGDKATQAKIAGPDSIFVDSAGNLFIADSINHRIRRVDAQTGIITTVAGTGQFSFSGDGGKATEANLNIPNDIFIDSAGNLFIADRNSGRIRRVDGKTGIITTVAGTGQFSFSGDGGKATEADLNVPNDVFIDFAGNLFTSDISNNRIRRVESIAAPTTLKVGVFAPPEAAPTPTDTTSPKLTSSTPKNGEKDVDSEKVTKITLQFDETVTVSSVKLAPVVGDALQIKAEAKDKVVEVTLLAGAKLAGGQKYELTGKVKDAAGNESNFKVVFETKKIEVKPPTAWSFSLSLKKGLSMISLALKPDKSFTAKSFAALLGATVVIRYDTAQSKFEAYIPTVAESTQTEGFPIEGGQGYIVNVLEDKQVKFTGQGWGEPMAQAAPPYIAEALTDVSDGVWAFVVSGLLEPGNHRNSLMTQPANIVVKNLRSGTTMTTTASDQGDFQAIFVDMNRTPVVLVGDMLEAMAIDRNGKRVSGPFRWRVEAGHLHYAYMQTRMRYGDVIPDKTRLLANYPNPFNPETWIPYELAESDAVRLDIYDVSGRLVRSMRLGYKPAGMYLDKSRAVYWDGRNNSGERVGSGVYLYRLQAGIYMAVKKMVVLK